MHAEPGFRFASLSVIGRDVEQVLREVSRTMIDRLGEHADLALVFASRHFAAEAGPGLAAGLRRAIGARVMVGCCAEGVIGPRHEIEDEPALAVVAAQLPGVELQPFFLPAGDLAAIAGDPARRDGFHRPAAGTRCFVMLADPFTTPMDGLLEAYNRDFPGIPIIGGMASGARQPGESVLFFNEETRREGVVGVGFSGPIEIDVIVSQGCRPVGPVFEVTDAQANIIDSLGGLTPLEAIGDLLEQLDEEDSALLRNGLFIGRAIDPGKESLGRGDFLVRGVLGADSRSGAIAVGDVIAAGERVQFHLRDARTAREDLEMMLSPHALFGEPSGAFLFSCNGRGTHLYGEPDGDIAAINSFFRGIDLAGFFCAGEIGPIGGRNFLHGHTASLALIRPAAKPATPGR